MSTVEPNHPLAEILVKKLFGIEIAPRREQTKMVNRAIKAAVQWVEAKTVYRLNQDKIEDKTNGKR